MTHKKMDILLKVHALLNLVAPVYGAIEAFRLLVHFCDPLQISMSTVDSMRIADQY